VSRQLASDVRRIVGVDISQGMVDYYNERVFNQGIPPEEMQAKCVDITKDATPLGDEKFDLIVVSLTASYHLLIF
jgi:SAM-dependent methyltransferase